MDTNWPIFIISLEGQDARRQPLVSTLNNAGLKFRVYPGIDGRQGLLPHWERAIDREAARDKLGRTMTSGEFGCALSHRAVYETIIAENLDGAIIFEDDAEIGNDFIEFVRQEFYRTKTLVLFDYRYGRSLPWQKKVCGRWTFHRAAQRATLASAYSVSKNTAERLLKAHTPVSYVADWPEDLWDLKAWLVAPRIAAQRNENENPSLIGNRELGADLTSLAAAEKKRRPDGFVAYLRRRLARPVGR